MLTLDPGGAGACRARAVRSGDVRRMTPDAVGFTVASESRSESPPMVVISVDLEQRWGLHDHLGLDRQAYRTNLENGRAAIPAMLRVFGERELRVTWAAVGALACRDWNEYLTRAPSQPAYHDPRFAIDARRYADMDPAGVLHFAPRELELIAGTPGNEIGTHTFSHLYLQEDGVCARDVRDDLRAVARLWCERFGAPPLSLVFPRNQVAFEQTIIDAGIRIWRGNPVAWYHNRYASRTNGLASRALRLADALMGRSRFASVPEGFNCRASLFVRFDLSDVLWRMHMARIRRGLDSALPGAACHLWFHEHNLGRDAARRIARLAELCDAIAERCSRGRLLSRHMADLARAGGCESRLPDQRA